MLTGARPFDGDDVSDTLAAVLRGEPDWSALPPRHRADRAAALERCLEKDPRERLQAIGDARIEIEGGDDRPRRGRGVTRCACRWQDRAAAAYRSAGGSGSAAILAGARRGCSSRHPPQPPLVTRSLLGIQPFERRSPRRPAKRVPITAPRSDSIALTPTDERSSSGPGRHHRATIRSSTCDKLEHNASRRTEGADKPLHLTGWRLGRVPERCRAKKVPIAGGVASHCAHTGSRRGSADYGASWGRGRRDRLRHQDDGLGRWARAAASRGVSTTIADKEYRAHAAARHCPVDVRCSTRSRQHRSAGTMPGSWCERLMPASQSADRERRRFCDVMSQAATSCSCDRRR